MVRKSKQTKQNIKIQEAFFGKQFADKFTKPSDWLAGERTKGDVVYNARRRAKRALTRLQRELAEGKIEADKIAETNDYIKQTQEFISKSYGVSKKADVSQIRRLTETSKAIQETSKYKIEERFSNYRNDEVFKREINQASVGGVSKFSKEETKIFYAATQKIWQGKSIEQRNRLIKEHFGVDTLEEAWNKVFALPEVQKALEQAKQSQSQAMSSEDETISNGFSDEIDAKGSPTYIKELILDLNT